MSQFFGVEVPFLTLLGFHGVRSEHGETELWVDVRPDMTNHFATAHGGVVATMLDVAMASAARTSHPDTEGAMTVSITLNFLRAPEPGRLTARGRVRQAGRSLVFCEAEVEDAQGRVAATAIGTFKLRTRAR